MKRSLPIFLATFALLASSPAFAGSERLLEPKGPGHVFPTVEHAAVDATRMAVTGSSHGALISVLAAARQPDRFRCLVEACGVMDVVTWYHYLVENDFDVSDSDNAEPAVRSRRRASTTHHTQASKPRQHNESTTSIHPPTHIQRQPPP